MPKETDRKYILMGFKIVADFGATIAIPVVLFAYIGRRIDAHFGIKPWATLVGFAIAAALTTVMIRRKARVYGQEYEALIQEEKKQTPPTL